MRDVFLMIVTSRLSIRSGSHAVELAAVVGLVVEGGGLADGDALERPAEHRGARPPPQGRLPGDHRVRRAHGRLGRHRMARRARRWPPIRCYHGGPQGRRRPQDNRHWRRRRSNRVLGNQRPPRATPAATGVTAVVTRLRMPYP